MITAKQLVQEYYDSIGKYTYDQRDCIHSIWEIIKAHGGQAKQVGSNWFARHKIINMRPLTSRSQLYDGCAVLKTKLPGEAGYNLPSQYRGDVDQIDYNHIGLGTSEGVILDSTRYTNAKGEYVRNGPGISTAPIGENSWDIIGDFDPSDVDYSLTPGAGIAHDDYDTSESLYPDVYRMVTAESGSTVNLRAAPNTKPRTIVREKVKIGSKVQVLEVRDAWQKVRAPSGKVGWIKTDFLQEPLENAGENTPPSDRVTLSIDRDTAQSLLLALKEVLTVAADD